MSQKSVKEMKHVTDTFRGVVDMLFNIIDVVKRNQSGKNTDMPFSWLVAIAGVVYHHSFDELECIMPSIYRNIKFVEGIVEPEAGKKMLEEADKKAGVPSSPEAPTSPGGGIRATSPTRAPTSPVEAQAGGKSSLLSKGLQHVASLQGTRPAEKKSSKRAYLAKGFGRFYGKESAAAEEEAGPLVQPATNASRQMVEAAPRQRTWQEMEDETMRYLDLHQGNVPEGATVEPSLPKEIAEIPYSNPSGKKASKASGRKQQQQQQQQ
jgi:hypothetical protein